MSYSTTEAPAACDPQRSKMAMRPLSTRSALIEKSRQPGVPRACSTTSAQPEQLAAWDELAALTRDDEFRAVMRALVARHDPIVLRKDPFAAVRNNPEAVHELVTQPGVTMRDL